MQGTGATTAAVSRLAAELQKQEVLVKAEFLERKRIQDTPTAHKEFAIKRLNSRSYQILRRLYKPVARGNARRSPK